MIRVLIGLLALALVVVFVQSNLPRPEPKAPQDDSRRLIALLERANQYTRFFYSGDFESLTKNFSQPMGLLLPEQELTRLRDRVLAELGEELEVLDESIAPKDEQFLYDRIARFSKYDGQVQIQMTLDVNGQIVGVTIQPIHQSN